MSDLEETVQKSDDKIEESDSTATVENDKSVETKTPKRQPETQALCNCPQKCYDRVPNDVRDTLYKGFSSLSDNLKQNEYLQCYIEMRSVYKRLWAQEERIGGRLQRRVSCKYKIPLDDPDSASLIASHHSPKIRTNSRGKITYTVSVKEGVRTIEVCQKAFMNIYGITEKRIRLQREKLIAKLRSRTQEPPLQQNITGNIKEDSKMEIQWSPEQATLEAFFGNQLWRPEYIGMSADGKIQHSESIQTNIKA